MTAHFLIINLHTQLALILNNRPTRLLYTMILLLTNKPQISSTGKIVISLFRTFLSLTMLFATYVNLGFKCKSFLFSVARLAIFKKNVFFMGTRNTFENRVVRGKKIDGITPNLPQLLFFKLE